MEKAHVITLKGFSWKRSEEMEQQLEGWKPGEQCGLSLVTQQRMETFLYLHTNGNTGAERKEKQNNAAEAGGAILGRRP